MTYDARVRYTLLPRPLSFDRRALVQCGRWSLDVERQLNAIERRRRLGGALRSATTQCALSLARRLPPG